MRISVGAIQIGLIVTVTGCAPDAVPSGVVLFQNNCVACHGVTGAGNGPLARDLPVAPANLRGLSAANGGRFPTEDVMAKIYGYHDRDLESVMPEFEPVLEGPTVIWSAPGGRDVQTPEALIALTKHVETLQDQ